MKLGAGSLGHTKHSLGFSGGFSQAVESVALPAVEPTDPQHSFQFVNTAILFYTGWASVQVTPYQNTFVLMLVSGGSNSGSADTLSARLVYSTSGVSGTWNNVSLVTSAIAANYYWTVQGCINNPTNNYYYGFKLWRSAGVGTLTRTFKGKDVHCTTTLIEPPERIFIQANLGVCNRPTFTLGTNPVVQTTEPARIYTHCEVGNEYWINHTDSSTNMRFRTHSYDKTYGSFRLYHGDVDLVNTAQILQHSANMPYYDQNTLVNNIYFRRVNPTLGFREADYTFTA